ncbi:hypothetical protein ACHAQJ_000076 [Trichoderma viride]
MDDDGLPIIDLNPSSSDTVNSADNEVLSSQGGEPLLGGHDQPPSDHDQPPQDGAPLDVVPPTSGPVPADSNIFILQNALQDEESEASDDENASTTSDQGENSPSSESKNNANLLKEPELPRPPAAKLNAYGDCIHDSDEEDVYKFVGPDAAKYLTLWHHVHEKSYDRKKRISELEKQNKQREGEIKALNREIERLTLGKPRHTEVTWPSLIESRETWDKVYSTACREGNSSPVSTKLHPDLRLRRPTEQELQADLLQTRVQLPEMSRSFNIPADLQFQILRHLFNFKGSVVHAISRLDPYVPAEEVPLNRFQKPCFLHRLHVGRSPVNITFASDPNVFLSPLLGRFAKGIRANIQRLQHVEILWVGSQYLTFALNARKKFTSRRTFSLVWLPEAIRLKTLGVYVQESSEAVMRRKHEPRGIINHMKGKTQLHPNFRGFRALRTLQGVDYVYCLRGLDRVEFWDFDRWLTTEERKRPVRDFQFIMDVNNSVRRPKETSDRSKSQLKNLFPLINSFVPLEQDWTTLLGGLEDLHTEEKDVEDDVSPPSPPTEPERTQENESGSPAPGVVTIDSDTSSESSSDSDSDSDSDSHSDSGSSSDSDSDSDADGHSPTEGGLVFDDSRSSVESSQATGMVPQLESLHLQDSGPHDYDEDSDDGSTIVPDNRSIAERESQVVDLTIEGDGNDGSDSESRSNGSMSTQDPSVGNRQDSPMFVPDEGYIPPYSPSSTGQIQDDRNAENGWEIRSVGTNRITSRPESETSLFIGNAPSYMNETPSLGPTRSRGSPPSSTVLVDLTGPDDLVDSFLPSENLTLSPDSRKRLHVKEEEEDGADTPESSKRLRTSSPEPLSHT